jgi:hypothetical protein
MSEVERYEGDIPMRVVFLQGWGHGPVYVRSPGLFHAKCVHPGCHWRGSDHPYGDVGDHSREMDARAHLDFHLPPKHTPNKWDDNPPTERPTK